MQPDRVKITEFRRRYCGLFKVKPSFPNGPDRPTLSTAIVVGPRAIVANLETLCAPIELNSDRRGLLFSTQDTIQGMHHARRRRVVSELAVRNHQFLDKLLRGHHRYFLEFLVSLVVQCAKRMVLVKGEMRKHVWMIYNSQQYLRENPISNLIHVYNNIEEKFAFSRLNFNIKGC